MRRRPIRKMRQGKKHGQREIGTLEAFAVILLAACFLPWQNIISLAPSVSAADIHAERQGTVRMATVMPDVIGLPVRLKIPAIKVNAAIEQVGLKKDGSMDTPKLPKNAAWFGLGPKPGQVGSAVIAGHVNWWNGAFSAFANLNKVKLGDKVQVVDDKGSVMTFTVRKVQRLNVGADATDVFFSTDGKARLNLVTCIGTWNKKTRQYSQRLIVFADKDSQD